VVCTFKVEVRFCHLLKSRFQISSPTDLRCTTKKMRCQLELDFGFRLATLTSGEHDYYTRENAIWNVTLYCARNGRGPPDHYDSARDIQWGRTPARQTTITITTIYDLSRTKIFGEISSRDRGARARVYIRYGVRDARDTRGGIRSVARGPRLETRRTRR